MRGTCSEVDTCCVDVVEINCNLLPPTMNHWSSKLNKLYNFTTFPAMQCFFSFNVNVYIYSELNIS